MIKKSLFRPAIAAVAAGALALGSLVAQTAGSGSGSRAGSGTPAPSVGTQPGRGTAPGNQSAGIDDGTLTSMPIFLSGKVLMDDGSPLPQGLTIQQVCGSNSAKTVSHTDSKGHFSFQWGHPIGVMPDASEQGEFQLPGQMQMPGSGSSSQSMGNQGGSRLDPLMGCELRANAAGFRSDPLSLSGHHPMDNPDLGMIVLHRIANVEGTSISATALNAPKDARKAYEKGLQFLHKARSAEAAKEFEKALAIYPKYANAWVDLGRARMTLKDQDGAREAFLKAIGADGKLVDAHAELGLLAAQQQNWAETVQYLDRALKLDPVDFPQLWFPDAIANFNAKNYEAAERSAREAVKADLKHQNPRTSELLGLVLVERRDYAGAGTALRTYLNLSPGADDQDKIKAQLAQIESLQAAVHP